MDHLKKKLLNYNEQKINIFFSLFCFEKVAFVRHRDLHILTVGSYTYTTDQRFIATHHKKTDEWTLQIKWTQKRDAGVILLRSPGIFIL